MSGKKILIIHNFGGVGKSTIAACLIHPRSGGEILRGRRTAEHSA